MPTSNDNGIETELSKALSETTSLAQTLLGEIRDNATSLATLKVQLDSLAESVKSLSKIIRDGNGNSLVTRLAIVERDLKDLAGDIKYHIEHDERFEKEIHARVSSVKNLLLGEKKSDEEFGRQKTISMLKLAAVALPGAIALVIKIIELLST